MQAVILIGLYVLIAVLSKLIGSGLAAASLGIRSALVVGVGMVPRGEVGVIIAGNALASGAIGHKDYSMLVIMSIVTTIVVPPVLRVLLEKIPRQESTDASENGLIAIDEAGLN
jgi:Kef-type K+ transport system membrane component KefB